MKNRLFVGALSLVSLGGFHSFAQETNAVVNTNTLYISKVAGTPEDFFGRLVTYAGEHGHQNLMQDLTLRLYPDPFAYNGEQITSIGQDIMADSFADAGRQIGEESAGYFFFRGVYESSMDGLGGFFSSKFKKFGSIFVRNTINGTAEEALDQNSLAFQPSKERWLQKLNEDGDVSFGLRPGSSPYFFVSTHIQRNGRELAFINMRCYYRKLESFQARFLVSVPIDKRWSLDTAFTYTPTEESDRYGTVSVGIIRLERRIGKHGFLFIGEQLSKNNSTLIGFSREW
ncbi:MAG: hypothetical protein QG640_118 [Patescibacteria group bacterium]|nr:hypothetical protein [Patescibacteria group bacterium]